MAKERRKRKTYTDAQRNAILAAAQKEGLTAGAVQKKFGVTPVTYYSWRKKKGVARRRGHAVSVKAATGGLVSSQVRAEVQSRVRRIIVAIVRSEVSSYLNTLFGNRRGRRRRA
jgi:transposase-like protein